MYLELCSDERDELVRLIEHELSEVRQEMRHTDTSAWRDSLHEEEQMLYSLHQRLKILDQVIVL